MLQKALQSALDRELNGKSLLELATSGRAKPQGQGEGQGQDQAASARGHAASGGAGQPSSQSAAAMQAAEEGRSTAIASAAESGSSDVADSGRRLGSDSASAPRLRQAPAEAAAAEATVGNQPTMAGDAAAAAAHGPPPAVAEALELVDLSTARGGIMTSETGDLVLEVRFGPTDRARRMLRRVLIGSAVLVGLIIAIILIAVLAAKK